MRTGPFSKKMAALRGAAKFREETSKKAGRQSRLAAVQHGAHFFHVNPLRPIADGGVTAAGFPVLDASEQPAHSDVPERVAAPDT
jgi:hypothetical protein